MTKIVTWNIQFGRMAQGEIDLRRPGVRTRVLAPDADVVCMQEVVRCMPELDGGAGEDQVAALAEIFRGYEPVFGPSLSRHPGGFGPRREFGNLILSRLPILQVTSHALPQPPAPGIKHMPRQAIEAVVLAPFGPLRITTTHLEYHSAEQRTAQAERLLAIHAEAAANGRAPGLAVEDGPYAAAPRPADAILCGDFNALVDDDVYKAICRPGLDGAPAFADAWRIRHKETPHAPTCGVHDRKQWPKGPHCRDYFFVTGGLATRVENIEVDAASMASDHQPIILTLAD